jgi:hypothetical protein
LIKTMFLWKTPFFRWKLAKIEEISDHNIDPRRDQNLWRKHFQNKSLVRKYFGKMGGMQLGSFIILPTFSRFEEILK